MRLDFNVLWVDDQPDSIEAQIEGIGRMMLPHGFRFNPKLCRSIDEVRGAIHDEIFRDEIDLILVDWDLGGGTWGQDAIVEIRDTSSYKNIVFYSALTEPQKLREEAFEENLEGIFCATRHELVDEVIGVFESLIKKVLDLDHTRGIVMGSTSDIDHTINECLREIYRKSDEEGKKEIISLALDRVLNHAKSVEEMSSKLTTGSPLEDFIESHMIFSANDRLILLRKILKKEKFESFREHVDHLLSYQQNVVPLRNSLGHIAPGIQDGRKVLYDVHGVEVTLESTRFLRCQILEYRGHFRDLLASLQGYS